MAKRTGAPGAAGSHSVDGTGNRGRRYSQEDRERFFHLVFSEQGPGLSVARAARVIGCSTSTADKWANGYYAKGMLGRNKGLRDLPAPKEYGELREIAQICLQDFPLFREFFYDWPYQRWAQETAERVVAAVMDPTERSFLDINVFPGAGKTTMMRHLVTWLICGGGSLDPRFGRALRVMVGARSLKVAKHMVGAIRNDLELRRPFYNKFAKDDETGADAPRYAGGILVEEYGRFRPDRGMGEPALWAADQFLVAQIGGLEIYTMEPTVQAASEESGFLGERVNLAVWDDLAVDANSRGPDQQEDLGRWFENEAEQRIEPGGTLILIGQRLSRHDLHRHRLDATVVIDEESDETKPLYHHIVFPSHHDELCDANAGGGHRQWVVEDGVASGCITDAWRLPVKDWRNAQSRRDYRTVFQQEDTDPGSVLVKPQWILGMTDDEGFPSPGCLDRERAWNTWPTDAHDLIDYIAVDPSGSGFWGIEHWAYDPKSTVNYLIWLARTRMAPGKLLDWDQPNEEFTGFLEDRLRLGALFSHPIRCVIVEENAFARWLKGFQHWERWRLRWPNLNVIPHQTQRNKRDRVLGVTGLLPGRYKTGMKRIPVRPDMGIGGGYQETKLLIKELTSYQIGEKVENTGYDLVMADWIGETNLPAIVSGVQHGRGDAPEGLILPPYLERQRREVPIG